MSKNTLYQRLADRVAEQIRSQLYQPGDKLPSLRVQSQAHKVSIATVQEAYERLEAWGMIEARPQSGFYVKPLPVINEIAAEIDFPVEGPAPVSISQSATRLFQLSQQAGFVNLGTAYPDQSFLPLKSLKRITADVAKQQIAEVGHANFAPGSDSLRRQLAIRMSSGGCPVSADDIVITSGCQEALSLSLRAIAKPGDSIAIESPTFVGILQAIEALGLQAIEIPSHPTEGISISALELALEQWNIKGCVLIPSFNNPSGACMPLSRREQLLRLLEPLDLPIIEDALFEDLAHNGKPLPSLKSMSKKPENILYCSSVSKSIAPGIRVGWVAAGKYQSQIEFLKSFLSVGSSGLDSLVVTAFLKTGNYARHIRSMQQVFANQINLFSAAIHHYFPRQTTVSRPRGGYVLWLGLPAEVDAWQVYQSALKKQITIVPGHLFSTTLKYQHFIRINCALPWNDQTRRALAQLGEIVQRIADDT